MIFPITAWGVAGRYIDFAHGKSMIGSEVKAVGMTERRRMGEAQNSTEEA